MATTGDTAHIYVLGEVGDKTGPVKIGIHRGPPTDIGHAGLNTGNHRELRVIRHEPIPVEDLRWTEWVIHRRLRRRHVRGEWFDVRGLVIDNDWKGFLEAVRAGTLDGLHSFELAKGEHKLVSVRQLPVKGRHFEASCSCGYVLDGGPGKAMPTVIKKFAISHLGLKPGDPQLAELQVEVHHPGFKLPSE